MLDQITGRPDDAGWGLPGRPVVADAGYGDITEFHLGVHARGLPYVVAVKGITSAYPAHAVPTAPTLWVPDTRPAAVTCGFNSTRATA